jgi:hypothetical protein
MTRSNPVDPAGHPVTRPRPGFFFQMGDLKPIGIYILYVPKKKNYVFSMWDKKLFGLNTST